MASVSTYLNFNGRAEEAFNFYLDLFGGSVVGPVMRFADMPAMPGQPAPPPDVARMILHMEITIHAGHHLHTTDAPDAFGFKVIEGNNAHIFLDFDTIAEASRVFAALSEGGKVEMPMQPMFWGATFGSLKDRFGVNWMINTTASA